MTSSLTRLGAACLGVCALAVPHTGLHAKPLPTTACAKLAEEYTQLVRGGVEMSMQLDPESAHDALKSDEIANIERFLFIEGQIRFRCPEIRLPAPPVPEQAATQNITIERDEVAEPAKPGEMPLPRRNPHRATGSAS